MDRLIVKKTFVILSLILSFSFLNGCDNSKQINIGELADVLVAEDVAENSEQKQKANDISDENTSADLRDLIGKAIKNRSDKSINFNGITYKIIDVDGGDISGDRKALVAVDIGFGDREYWAFTNEYGQLVFVYADIIILQDDKNEPVTSSGRYYNDEAKVPGTERKDLDEGHIIADSLGGVSNAYNITPQNSTLNRHGDQAYMEKVIRDAGGCENFFAVITYPDTKTQIPSHYHYEYIINRDNVVEDFDNVDPDEVNKELIEKEKENTKSNHGSNNERSNSAKKDSKNNKDKKSNNNTDKKSNKSQSSNNSNKNAEHDLSAVDKNGDGKVTIAEAKAAGYKMPIDKEHWLYPYMDDRDGDGLVGE